MRKKWLICAVMSLLGIALFPNVASADVNDFTITNFTADYYLNRNDPQGQLDVTEKIYVRFTDYNHGLLRALPKSYKNSPLKIKIKSVSSDSAAPSTYSTYTSNGNMVLKIGDAFKTVTGDQEYTIRYSEQNVIGFYPDHDELYWDINGDQWNQPVQYVRATVHLPEGVKLWSEAPKCYAGSYGSSEGNCAIISSDQDKVVAGASDLGPNQTLSVVIGFDKGYFTPPTLWDHIKDYHWIILNIVLPTVFGFLVGFIWWFRRGRDARGRGTIIPEYTPPDGLSPLESGTIADFKVDNRDITATIIDMARRGYLKIIETRQDHALRKSTVSYTLELRNVDFTDLNTYETRIMEALFVDMKTGAQLELKSSKNKLYMAANDLRETVDTDLTDKGYFVKNPRRYTFKGAGLIIAVVIFCNAFGGAISSGNMWALVVGTVIGLLIFLGFVAALSARTAKGVSAKEQLLGLKMYMETAEKDRLEKLEGPEAAYAANAGEPVRTVALFEKLLPYAIVLNVEKQWAGKFNDIYTSPPEWYSGNWTAFNAGYLAGSLNSGFTSAVNSSFSPPSSSGSSGFGGGGFSGGGGGGGGGGGW